MSPARKVSKWTFGRVTPIRRRLRDSSECATRLTRALRSALRTCVASRWRERSRRACSTRLPPTAGRTAMDPHTFPTTASWRAPSSVIGGPEPNCAFGTSHRHRRTSCRGAEREASSRFAGAVDEGGDSGGLGTPAGHQTDHPAAPAVELKTLRFPAREPLLRQHTRKRGLFH